MMVIKTEHVGVALVVAVALVGAAMLMPRLAVFVFIGTILCLIPYTLWRAIGSGQQVKAPGCVPLPSGDVVRVARPMASEETMEEDRWGSLQGRTVMRIAVVPEHRGALDGVCEGDRLQLVREPQHAVEGELVAVYVAESGKKLGYVSRGFGKALAGAMAAGEQFRAQVKRVGEGGEGGVSVEIWNVRGVGA